MFQKTPIAIALLISQAAAVHAQDIEAAKTALLQAIEPSANIEQTMIIGSKEQAATLPGSAYVLDNEELAKFAYKDINSILRDVPGVYLRQEEGFGLRPNIGIRGAVGERNNKITVMEDGILIAPAPYSGPSAYYFPSAGRLHSIEVLKGPATIAHGPFTVGGSINLLSTPIPTKATAAKINMEIGQNGEQRLHAWVGSRTEQTGLLFETYQQQADGFQSIDRYPNDTGFEKQDFLVKARWNTANDTEMYQQFDLRLSYSDENSNQSYLGLTDVDFAADADRRYGLTALDNMDNDHQSAVFSHLIKFNDDISISTDIYRNTFKRDWYKVDKIGGEKITDVIKFANEGNSTQIAQLHGTMGAGDTEVKIKHNAREYLSQGIQSSLNWQFATGTVAHNLKTGIRLHEDEVDRFQPSDSWDQINGQLIYQSTSLPGGSDADAISGDNRLQEASALSLFITDTMMINDDLDITAGLRFEDYDTQETRRSRNGATEVTATNDVSEVLPALGATYQLTPSVQVLAGYTKGFAVTEVGASNEDPEKSDNFEFGGRYIVDNLRIDLIGFYSDYSNAVKNCSVNSPCDNDDVSGSESYGAAEIMGLEFLANYTPAITDTLVMPITFSYTYTATEITEDSDSAQKGDILANVPENIASFSIGLQAARWDTYLKAAYTDEMCPNTSCDRTDSTQIQTTDDLLTFDWVGSYIITDRWSTYARVENLSDERAIISRQPAGARANKPRSAYVGINWEF
ncbi:MAG: TonB-dependent receptor [Pseudomonadales bacterium]|nr:TonB-dependent receptor [Pseudomonadales bacterium]